MKLTSIAVLLSTISLSLCSKSEQVAWENYIEILSSSQILEFDDLPQSYEITFDTGCNRYFTTVGFNYNGLDEENGLVLEIASDNERVPDGTYTFVNEECEYVDVTFYHSDLLDPGDDAYFKEGTMIISNRASRFEFSGQLYKLDANNEEFFIGNAKGLIVAN